MSDKLKEAVLKANEVGIDEKVAEDRMDNLDKTILHYQKQAEIGRASCRERV